MTGVQTCALPIYENGKIDDGDELVGNLEETETGIYEMKEPLYGKYIVRETKAPEGFLLDKGEYSVFIDVYKRQVLRKGESQRPDGTYQFRWTDENRKRPVSYTHLDVYKRQSRTLWYG